MLQQIGEGNASSIFITGLRLTSQERTGFKKTRGTDDTSKVVLCMFGMAGRGFVPT